MNEAIDIEGTIARLSEIEAERETLLEKLRTASSAIGEVLSCYPIGAAPKVFAEAPVVKRKRRTKAEMEAARAAEEAS